MRIHNLSNMKHPSKLSGDRAEQGYADIRHRLLLGTLSTEEAAIPLGFGESRPAIRRRVSLIRMGMPPTASERWTSFSAAAVANWLPRLRAIQTRGSDTHQATRRDELCCNSDRLIEIDGVVAELRRLHSG